MPAPPSHGLTATLQTDLEELEEIFSHEPVSVVEKCSATEDNQDDVMMAELFEVDLRGRVVPKTIKPRRQYVNLDAIILGEEDTLGHPDYGRDILLRARIKWSSASGNKFKSLEGKFVYWYFEKGEVVNREEPENCAGFVKGNELSDTLPVQTNADGWTDVVRFYLSDYGGDQFKVCATTKKVKKKKVKKGEEEDDPHGKGDHHETGKCYPAKEEEEKYVLGLKTGIYEVWRRLYFEITEMERMGEPGKKYELPQDSIDEIVKACEEAKLEFVDTGIRNCGDYRSNFLTDEEADAWADSYCSTKRVPYKVHFIVVDEYCPVSAKELVCLEETCVSSQHTLTKFVRPYDYDGQWLEGVWYTDECGEMLALPAACLIRGAPDSTGALSLTVDLTQAGLGTPLKPGGKVHINYYQKSAEAGRGGKNLHTAICRGMLERGGYREDYLNRLLASVGLHELGHALDLVDDSAEWRSPKHRDHCKFKSCVMWWKLSEAKSLKSINEIPTKFHSEKVSDPGCLTYVRGHTVSTSKFEFPRRK